MRKWFNRLRRKIAQALTPGPGVPHRSTHTAYAESQTDHEGNWVVRFYSHTPVGWLWRGTQYAEMPADVPEPTLRHPTTYPQGLAPVENREAWAKYYADRPQAIHLVGEWRGKAKDLDAARKAARAEINKREKDYRKPVGYGSKVATLIVAFVALTLVGSLAPMPGQFMWAGTLAFPTAVRNAWLDSINTALNAGTGAALIRIYDGSRPASGGAATTLLAELTCSDPASAGASSGVLTFSSITQDSSANATGTATWFRMVDSDLNWVIDGDVGTSGSDLNLTTTSITATQPVSISSAAITAPNA